MAWMGGELRILVLARSFVYPFASYRSLAEVSVLGGHFSRNFVFPFRHPRLLGMTGCTCRAKRHSEICPTTWDRLAMYTVYIIRHLGATETCYPFAARIIKFSICGAC